MRIKIEYHPERKEAFRLAKKIDAWLRKKGFGIVLNRTTGRWILDDRVKGTRYEVDPAPELVIAIGGDGFMMHCIGLYSPKGIDCIGINAGDVGFLTSGNADNWKEVMEKILSRKFSREKRTGLELSCLSGTSGPYVNDVYLEHPSSIGTFKVSHDGGVLYEEFMAKGVIVSTPTGSTGYNMAAGGTIIHPGTSAIVVTPICPNHVGVRSIIIPDASRVEIEVLSSKENKDVILRADGRHVGDLQRGDKISVKQHPTRMLFAVTSRQHFYEALKNKKGLMR